MGDDEQGPDTERQRYSDRPTWSGDDPATAEDFAAVAAEQEPLYQAAWDRYVYQWQARRMGAGMRA